MKKVLGSKSPKALTIKSINTQDKILFFTSLQIEKTMLISFFGYGMVENSFDLEKSLLGFDNSKRKIKLKGIKYFRNPVPVKNIIDNLNFIKHKKRSSDYFRSEFREISQQDFNFIINNTSTTKTFPDYFYSKKLMFTEEDFLIKSIRGLHEISKNTEKSNQIEIKKFVKLLYKLTSSYGISKSYEEIENYYAENIWKLGFEHAPSRNPENLVKLYGPKGNSQNFGYIKLN